MTPRERWLALLAGEKPDRVPTDHWATDEVTSRVMRELRCNTREELYTTLNIDALAKLNPQRKVTHQPGGTAPDEWGVRWKPVNYGTGIYLEEANHPLADMSRVEEIR